ncbi:MAG: hypothetical protein Q9227_006032 [Pyrenula ochraceoflavens]
MGEEAPACTTVGDKQALVDSNAPKRCIVRLPLPRSSVRTSKNGSQAMKPIVEIIKSPRSNSQVDASSSRTQAGLSKEEDTEPHSSLIESFDQAQVEQASAAKRLRDRVASLIKSSEADAESLRKLKDECENLKRENQKLLHDLKEANKTMNELKQNAEDLESVKDELRIRKTINSDLETLVCQERMGRHEAVEKAKRECQMAENLVEKLREENRKLNIQHYGLKEAARAILEG